MDIHIIDDAFAVAPQIQASDMAQLSAQGFVSIICNRPDGEEADQPDVTIMRAAAQNAGLAFHHIPVSGPVTGPDFPPAAIAAFRAIRLGTKGPILAYCRTGNRSITLDTLANPHSLTADARLKRGTDAGYDLSSLRDQLGA